MSVQTALTAAQDLGGRSPGHLITAQDWNTMASVLVEYGNALLGLPATVAELQTQLDTLSARVDALEALPARVEQLEDELAPLREQYRLTASMESESVLVGQVVEIVFQVTALDSSPLTGPRPWLDVVATWGRLRGAPGFTVRENAEENALAIQVNDQGIARVQLRGHHTRGFTMEAELGFSSALATQVGNTGLTVMQSLSQASSPLDAQAQMAFQTMNARYDASPPFRAYADGYIGQMTGGRYVGGHIGGFIQVGQWQNFRATVMAFAKPDSSAVTPDPTRGVATIQVNFREWLAHWSDGYVKEVTPVLPGWRDLFENEYARVDALPFFTAELNRRAPVVGALGHVRNLLAVESALAQVLPGTDTVKAQSRDLLAGAVTLQFAAGGNDARAATSYATQAQVGQAATQVARSAQTAAADAASTKQSVLLLEDRVKAAEQTGKEISAGLRTIGDGVNKINVAEVADLGSRLSTINVSLNQLASRIPGT